MGYKNVPIVVGYSDSPINLKNTGATLVFTTQDKTKLFFPYKIRIYCNAASGVLTPPTLSIGSNASSYNNILGTVEVLGLVAAQTFIDYEPTFPIAPISSDVGIFVNVTVGATGTTLNARVALYGDTL